MNPTPPWILAWLVAKERSRCAPETVRRYRWAALRSDHAIREAGRPPDPARWTADDARWLRRRFHDEVHQLAVTASLARFCGNPVFRSVGPPRRGPPKRVRWLTPEQTDALLEVVRRDRHLRLVALLGLAQGLRRGDWVRLRLSDLDLAEGRMRISVGPGSRARPEWRLMHPALPDALRDYLRIRRRKIRRFLRAWPSGGVPDELFLHVRGGLLSPYRPHGTEKWMAIIERRLALRGVEIRLSTDMLRRRGAELLAADVQGRPEATPGDAERALRAFLRTRSFPSMRDRLRTLGDVSVPPGSGPDPDRPRPAGIEGSGGSGDERSVRTRPGGARDPQRPRVE